MARGEGRAWTLMEVATREGASVQVRPSTSTWLEKALVSAVTAPNDLMEDHLGEAVHRESAGGSGQSRAVAMATEEAELRQAHLGASGEPRSVTVGRFISVSSPTTGTTDREA